MIAQVFRLSCLCLLAAGCGGDWQEVVPTNTGYEARLQGFMGQSINTAVAELGTPTRVVDLAQGSKS